ncbi:hypothetical protein BJ875DRAFT_33643 [Amylocarpus encephaloides]|uniref:Uncharacterized protein n=1 Tax=Amylocarpus encephaloides TaxID=45428 RepID=A0A9P7YRH1_9HELO|nr:hypothetical protein BJ875DRAFT_33643 [Amylocarpus encephaloides]
MRKLQIWLQLIAKIGERRDFRTDRMWKTLVEWNSQRLSYYRRQLGSSFQDLGVVCSTENISADAERVARKLAFVRAFCEETPTTDADLAIGLWGECITICYELRYEPGIVPYITSLYQSSGVVDIQGALRLKRNVAFFGRLRSAYEAFIEFALQFSFAKTVLIQPIEEPLFLQPRPYERSELSRHIAESDIDLMQVRIKKAKKLVKKRGEILGIILRDIAEPVKVHAEIKILLFFSSSTFQSKCKTETSTYIRCSKRPCFLCWHILQCMPSYSTRGSHGKIYSRWTIPSATILTEWSCIRLHAAISKIGISCWKNSENQKESRGNIFPSPQ